jgi:hypothetical protein
MKEPHLLQSRNKRKASDCLIIQEISLNPCGKTGVFWRNRDMYFRHRISDAIQAPPATNSPYNGKRHESRETNSPAWIGYTGPG